MFCIKFGPDPMDYREQKRTSEASRSVETSRVIRDVVA